MNLRIYEFNTKSFSCGVQSSLRQECRKVFDLSLEYKLDGEFSVKYKMSNANDRTQK